MELLKSNIVGVAGKIIQKYGIKSLTVEELGREIEIDNSLLNPYFKNYDDILLLIILDLENEIKQLINDPLTSVESPEEEFQLIFENIHKLLENKPYYLSVIFFTETTEKNSELQNALLRIKLSVRTFLLEIIDDGKRETVFKTKLTSKALVNNILGSFRSFMNEQRITARMVKDLEILKEIND